MGEYRLDLLQPVVCVLIALQGLALLQQTGCHWHQQLMPPLRRLLGATLGSLLQGNPSLGTEDCLGCPTYGVCLRRLIDELDGLQSLRLVIGSVGCADSQGGSQLDPLSSRSAGVVHCSHLVDLGLLTEVLPQLHALQRRRTLHFRWLAAQRLHVLLGIHERTEQFVISRHALHVWVFRVLVDLAQFTDDGRSI
ncbi:hypothetical protein AQJ11_42105 [Streptomyces corchorusii]|uniref:Uncharacterized protein n=1 Tax=Streptomyces corchorusii TaxID=1903 RepID=A0A101PQP1_STRCK|nr:hypothetical protein AQJ11_42105 [Streptomyces corchorusii]